MIATDELAWRPVADGFGVAVAAARGAAGAVGATVTTTAGCLRLTASAAVTAGDTRRLRADRRRRGTLGEAACADKRSGGSAIVGPAAGTTSVTARRRSISVRTSSNARRRISRLNRAIASSSAARGARRVLGMERIIRKAAQVARAAHRTGLVGSARHSRRDADALESARSPLARSPGRVANRLAWRRGAARGPSLFH